MWNWSATSLREQATFLLRFRIIDELAYLDIYSHCSLKQSAGRHVAPPDPQSDRTCFNDVCRGEKQQVHVPIL